MPKKVKLKSKCQSEKLNKKSVRKTVYNFWKQKKFSIFLMAFMAEERAEELKREGHSDDCATLQGLDLMCQLESNYVDIMIRCNKHCSKCGI